jgi:hypothetical protein
MPRILYAIQGTGNGHLSRALDVVPLLQARCAQLDVLVSGPPADLPLPFEVRHHAQGMGFLFGKKGGSNFVKTFLQFNSAKFLHEVRHLPVESYDLVISDFEPVSSWACKLRHVPCVALSHQSAVLHPAAPRPDREDPAGRAVLRHYAPSTAQYGFHFRPYAPGIATPVIRQQVRELNPRNEGHYTVYLPAYEEEILVERLQYLSRVVRWEVFSKHQRRARRVRQRAGVAGELGRPFSTAWPARRGCCAGPGFETPRRSLVSGQEAAGDAHEAAIRAAVQRRGPGQNGRARHQKLSKTKNLDRIDQWLHQQERCPWTTPTRRPPLSTNCCANNSPPARWKALL